MFHVNHGPDSIDAVELGTAMELAHHAVRHGKYDDIAYVSNDLGTLICVIELATHAAFAGTHHPRFTQCHNVTVMSEADRVAWTLAWEQTMDPNTDLDGLPADGKSDCPF